MRFIVAKRRGRRGEGLGNELFAWAKGWIASRVLEAKLVGPGWGLNPRRYYRNFRTSRFDVVWEEIGKHLPHFDFTEQDYRAAGKVDFGDAIKQWAEHEQLTPRNNFIVTVDGMYGGYPAIFSARHFIMSKLLNSRNAVENLYSITRTLQPNKLLVAVHVRSGGDFHSVQSDDYVRSQFNVAIPSDWYLYVCDVLKKQFGDTIQFYFLSNQHGASFKKLVEYFNPGQALTANLTECSDLLLLAHADLVIGSVSSYSLAASFLSGSPYIWYEPQLHLENEIYTMWGHERAQQKASSLTQQSIAFVRSSEYQQDVINGKTLHLGTAMAIGDPVPSDLISYLQFKLSVVDQRTNLLHYGALPQTRSKTEHGQTSYTFAHDLFSRQGS